MIAGEKERMLVELREYHLEEFPASFGMSELDDLLAQFRLLEDDIFSMSLGISSGRSEFVDYTDQLNAFEKKLKDVITEKSVKDPKVEIFDAKIKQLVNILSLAQKSTFSPRKSNKPKFVGKAVSTIITKKSTT